MVRGRFCPLACALVAAALSATAISQQTIDPQTQEQQQQPNIAQVQAYELTHVPGCTVAEDDRYELPAGMSNGSAVSSARGRLWFRSVLCRPLRRTLQ